MRSASLARSAMRCDGLDACRAGCRDRRVSPPQLAIIADSPYPDDATMPPGPRGSPGGESSSPVAAIATRGLRRTLSCATIAGREQRQVARASGACLRAARTSPSRKSRPAARMCLPGLARPSSRRGRRRPIVSSWMTMASAPSGTTPPVKMRTASPAPSAPRERMARRRASDHAKVSAGRHRPRAPRSRPSTRPARAAVSCARATSCASTRPAASPMATVSHLRSARTPRRCARSLRRRRSLEHVLDAHARGARQPFRRLVAEAARAARQVRVDLAPRGHRHPWPNRSRAGGAMS